MTNTVWEEIFEITKERYMPPQEDEISTIEFAEQMGIERRSAHDILIKCVKEKKLKVRKYKNKSYYSPL